MATSEEIAGIFNQMTERFRADKAGNTTAVIQFHLSGDNGGLYWVKVAAGSCETGYGEVEAPNMTLRASADDWHAIATGNLKPMQAFMMGKVKVQGDMELAMKMQSMFQI